MIQDRMPLTLDAPHLHDADGRSQPGFHDSPTAPRRDGASGESATRRPSYRVLVIEDDAHIARLISVNLTRAGLESRWAANGMAGLQAFADHPPHIVLLDLMMPIMDGFSVCEKIRGQSQVPIVIMTARLEPIHQMRGFRLGADDYVLKPFDPQLLVARLIAHLRRVYRYDHGSIHRKDEPREDGQEDRNAAATTISCSSCGADKGNAAAAVADVLSHMPEGWAGCEACNYMGPLKQFPRRFNGPDANALACPNCSSQGYVRFAVALDR